MQKSRESELAFRMITAHALVSRMNSMEWLTRPERARDTDTITIIGWLDILLKMPEDQDILAFTKKHAEKWLDSPEDVSPEPAYYAYAHSRGER